MSKVIELIIDNTQRVADYDKFMPEFTSQSQVELYFGPHNRQARATAKLFAANPDTVVEFVRDFDQQRAHIIGANESLAQIQQVSGDIATTFSTDGTAWDYNGLINLSNVTSISDAAQDVQNALNQSRKAIETIQNATITPESDTFMGHIDHVTVTPDQLISGEMFPIGAVISSGANLLLGTINDETILNHNGTFSVYGGVLISGHHTPEELIGASWGILTVPIVNAAAIVPGEQVVGKGVAPDTFIEGIGGTHNGLQDFIVNKTQSINGTVTLLPTQLAVVPNGNNQLTTGWEDLTISTIGWAGFDRIASKMTFPTGTAAKQLGLTSDTATSASLQSGMNVTWDNILDRAETQLGFTGIENLGQNDGISLVNWATQHGMVITHP